MLHAKPAKADVCGPDGNPIACENSLPGTPQAQWDMSKGDGATIQGFADPFSVNLGGTINFKIKSPATSYKIDIYRMGYYGGDGARLIPTSVMPNIPTSQNQPACNTNTATGLVDCSDWGVSASWTVPTDLVSGIYFAHIYRTDGTSDGNQIPFVVRDDASHSDILFKTNDETWEAYNSWGGYSLYAGNATDTTNRPTSLDPGRADQVSYDRPFSTRFGTPYGQDFFFYAEFPMIEFLEENGDNVSYIDQGTLASPAGASLSEQHKVLVAAGHDEYWSAQEVANVTAARNAGVNLAFFTGNELYWKTRLAPDAAGENNRTLVTYKESLNSAPSDPNDPPTWTGAWYDPRYSPPGDGGQPQNALTGQLWTVNVGTGTLTVPSQYSALRLWRNTSVASLQPGQTATLTPETLGYEWDQDVDNGFRPPGEFDLSSTTMTAPQVVQTYQEGLAQKTVTHNLTMYRAASGALVFGAGTVQWAWGLNSNHDGDAQPAPSLVMQQATVNLLADMGNVQPVTLMAGLTLATESTDYTPPTSTITWPTAGTVIPNGSTATVTGTATDSAGGVAGVEISTDGGSTWHPVTTMSAAATTVNWTYTWAATGAGQVTVETRATDDSGNIETPSDGVNVTVNCPCGLYSQTFTPSVTAQNDPTPLELGVKFQPTVNGWVAGVRFYKGASNNGTHTGSLWSATGTLLATGTFTNETAGGWQTLTFANPVQISANTTYVAGYYDPDGYYSADLQQFYPTPTGSIDASPLYSPPLVGIRANNSTGNGVFNSGGPGFPTSTFQGSGYGVDVIFDTTQPPGAPPSVVAQTPYPGSSSDLVSVDPTVTFNKAVVPSTLSFTLADSAGNVPGSVSFDPTDTIATFTPSSAFPAGTTVTVTVSGAQDNFGQAMTMVSNTFITAQATPPTGTCPCSLWPDSTAPATPDSGNSPTPVELGVKFMANHNGYISGIRFYKSAANIGTHTGTLWASAGTMLATGTFTNETTQGWQQLNFTTPVAITAGTTYAASYYDPSGHYAVTSGGLKPAVTNGPLTALASGTSANGVYLWNQDAFPTASYNASNYWVDVVYMPTPTIPAVTSANPVNNQTSVPTTSPVAFTLNEAVQPNSIAFSLTDSSGNSVPGSVSYNSSTNKATFTPSSALSNAMTYTGSVTAATDVNGNQMAAPFSWSFVTAMATAQPGQCPCSIWPDSMLPATPDANDPNAVNLGVKFTSSSNGYITGIRFYKGPTNTGTHVGSLWTSTGTLLGQVTFSNESAAGWQQATFAAPIPVTARTTYVASYLAPSGEYATLPKGLSSSVTYGPLSVPASGGVYAYGTSSTMPKSTYNAGNYFVDVMFSTTPS